MRWAAALLLLCSCKSTPQQPAYYLRGETNIPVGEMLIELTQIPSGQSVFQVTSPPGNTIRCGLFTVEGEPIVVDEDDRESCLMGVESEEGNFVYLAVRNLGGTSVHVTAVVM